LNFLLHCLSVSLQSVIACVPFLSKLFAAICHSNIGGLYFVPFQSSLIKTSFKNVAHVASEDTQGSHCGHPTTKVAIKEVKTEDEAKELLSQMTKEKEVFIVTPPMSSDTGISLTGS
jgi:hypothetical protein